MRGRTVFIVPVFCLRPFLRLAPEKVLTSGLDRALQFGYLPVLFPELPEQFGHLHSHRRCSLVALAEQFRKFRDLVRQFGYAPVAFLTGGFHLFHALTLVDGQLYQLIPVHVGIVIRHGTGRVLPTLQSTG